MKPIAVFFLASVCLAASAHAQELEDSSESFARVKGGAVYDWKIGVDGSLISEQFMLTHVTCTNGSDTLRVMLPLGPDDNETFYTMDGEPSSLQKSGNGWTADFVAGGKRIRKEVTLKPVNDEKSQNAEQYEITLRYGDPLWKAMASSEPGQAMMMIGTGGTPVGMPSGDTFNAFLKSCGIGG